jgi:hypothetical protein
VHHLNGTVYKKSRLTVESRLVFCELLSIEQLRSKSVFWDEIWLECGRPKSGVVADIMHRTRASYHYAIRCVEKNEQDVVRQRYAEANLRNHNRDMV